jgi:hypothetical protein
MDVRSRLSQQASAAGHLLLQGLRLFAPEDVAIGFLILDSPNQFFPADIIRLSGARSVMGRRMESAWGSAEFPHFASLPYTLTRSRARQLVDIWPHLSVNYADRRLDLAFRRFETSYDRNSPDDQLLDYWIALEALFLKETQELAYRAGLRIARFIGLTKADREDIFKEIKRSYTCRSKVVHGEEYPEEAKRKLTLETAVVLRRALHACLPERKAPDISALDRRLLH